MSAKTKASTSTTPPAAQPTTSGTGKAEGEQGTGQAKAGQISTTGELIRTTTSNTNTEPLLKSPEDYDRYQADVRTISEMQVDDIMAFQDQHGYVPRRGDTSIEKHGLNSEDQEAVLRGEKRLEVIDKEKGTYRAEAVAQKK